MLVVVFLIVLVAGGWYVRRQRRAITRVARAAEQTARVMQQQIDLLIAERNQAGAILDSMAEGVIALDGQGCVLQLNPAAARLFSLEAGVATGKPLMEVIRHHELNELVAQVRTRQQPGSRELTLLHPVARTLMACAVSCARTEPAGPSVVVVIQDLTELHRYERLRREFVANVSHELKSPLTAIRSLTETLLTGALEDAANRHRFVTLVDEEAARLGRLIEDLLQLSQIESQPVTPRVQAVPLRPLVQEVFATLQPELAKRRVRVSMTLKEQWVVQADSDRLRQVLMNLLDNAIKYNREGGSITVTAEPEGQLLRIGVADTGIGIPAEDAPRIFERFYRVDKARSRELGGTGLGLSIVKHIVESHGGTVTVTTRPGEGSTFSFTLPLA